MNIICLTDLDWVPTVRCFFPAICQVKEDPAEFYATTGNHNEWDVDRMQEGNVPRLSFACLLDNGTAGKFQSWIHELQSGET